MISYIWRARVMSGQIARLATIDLGCLFSFLILHYKLHSINSIIYIVKQYFTWAYKRSIRDSVWLLLVQSLRCREPISASRRWNLLPGRLPPSISESGVEKAMSSDPWFLTENSSIRGRGCKLGKILTRWVNVDEEVIPTIVTCGGTRQYFCVIVNDRNK
jgi:hypothetical protein